MIRYLLPVMSTDDEDTDDDRRATTDVVGEEGLARFTELREKDKETKLRWKEEPEALDSENTVEVILRLQRRVGLLLDRENPDNIVSVYP